MINERNYTHTRLRVVFVVLLLALGAGLRLEGFTDPWPDDWRGSMACYYGNIARNYLHFGFVETKGAPISNITPDSLDEAEYYFHHPPLTGWILTGVFQLSGPQEWAARLLPLIFSTGCMALVYFIGTRLWGQVAGVAALAVCAVLPGAVFYGSFVDVQGPLPLFFILWTACAYIRFCERTSWLRLAHILGAFAVGTLCDWPVYYMALLLPLHHLLFCDRRSRKILWLPVAGVMLFALFWTYAAWVEGVPAATVPKNVFSLALSRFQAGPGAEAESLSLARRLGKIFGEHLVHFYSLPCLALFLAGTLLLIVRLVRGTSPTKDGMLAVFTALGLMYVLMFLYIASLHDYWTYYFIPAVSLGIGMLSGIVSTKLKRRPLVAAAVVAVPLLLCAANCYSVVRQRRDATAFSYSLDAKTTGRLIMLTRKPGLLIPETRFPMHQHFAFYIPGKIFQADMNRVNLEAAAANPRVNWVYIDTISPEGDDAYARVLRRFKQRIKGRLLPHDEKSNIRTGAYRTRLGVLASPDSVLAQLRKRDIPPPPILEKKEEGKNIHLRLKHAPPEDMSAYIVYARPAGKPFYSMVAVVEANDSFTYACEDGDTVQLVVTAINKDYEEGAPAPVIEFHPQASRP